MWWIRPAIDVYIFIHNEFLHLYIKFSQIPDFPYEAQTLDDSDNILHHANKSHDTFS